MSDSEREPRTEPESFPGQRATRLATESQRRLTRATVAALVEQQRLAGGVGLFYWRLAGAPFAGASAGTAAGTDPESEVGGIASRGVDVERAVEATEAEVEDAIDEFDAFLSTFEPALPAP